MEVKNKTLNTITNILGIIVGVGSVVLHQMDALPEGAGWETVAGSVVAGIAMWFIGKKKK